MAVERRAVELGVEPRRRRRPFGRNERRERSRKRRETTTIALQTEIAETTTLGGRYRLMRRIGAGGMGTVWEAEDRVLRRRVAVKILAESLCGNAGIAARFEREAQAAGRLTHPNIAQVFDYGEDDGCPYIVLELVPGSTLRQILDARGRLPGDEVAAVGTQIADALAAAHSEGIVHRDVKPGNVMVAPDGRVKVMDFGIADAVWFEPITDTGAFLATAKYVSPEQATGGAATTASDVYSTGVVLYELLAGRPPFDGESPFAVAHAHAYDVPPPLARLSPDAPEALVAEVEAAMQKDPRLRPSASDLSAALAHPWASDAAPALAPPPADATTRVATATGGEAAASVRVERRSRRAAIWVLAAMALTAVVLSLALTAFSSPARRDALRRGDALTSVSSTGAGSRPAGDASAAPAPEGEGGSGGPGGKALGHGDRGQGGGHGDEGRGNDD
jgi:serine/threonine protein kinase